MSKNEHIPVLLDELIDNLKINQDKRNIIIDMTLGLGGHFLEVLKRLNTGDIMIGFDADIDNLSLAKKKINDYLKKIDNSIDVKLINSNFLNIKEELKKIGIEKVTGIYYDLGISSVHLDDANKGFSFRQDGPLDMRLDKTSGLRAKDIVNNYIKDDLKKIFERYGEEPMSKKIAYSIAEERKKNKFQTTDDLVKLIEIYSKDNKTKARIFQALRIETNKELENLEISLKDAIDTLTENSIIFVISFHSLEDRIVKNIFRQETKDCICKDLICSCGHKKQLKLINKKPILPTKEEIKYNPRSRSAKARIAIKI